MNKLKVIEKVLLDPRVLDSLYLASAGMETIQKKYAAIDVYEEILKETIEDLDKVIFLINQLKEDILK